MPFLTQITNYINETLKAGSLNKKELQPAKFYGLSTVVARKKERIQKKLELLPAIISAEGTANPILPDSDTAIQVYHKLLRKSYSYETKSHGDGHLIKSSSELALVAITNSKLTGKIKEILEPVVLFGMPQHLSTDLIADLKINHCLITPMESTMDALNVFKHEFPQSDYLLNIQMSMFSIRYKVETTFSQACVDKCLCG